MRKVLVRKPSSTLLSEYCTVPESACGVRDGGHAVQYVDELRARDSALDVALGRIARDEPFEKITCSTIVSWGQTVEGGRTVEGRQLRADN